MGSGKQCSGEFALKRRRWAKPKGSAAVLIFKGLGGFFAFQVSPFLIMTLSAITFVLPDI
jgi:hypothetical protein